MATFNEVEDLRDWFIDQLGEMKAKIALLDGDEPPAILERILQRGDALSIEAVAIIALLDELLVLKKQGEYEED